jgi:hypothetical protein
MERPVQFALLIYAPEDTRDEAILGDITARHIKLAQNLQAEGVNFSGERLKPSTEARVATWTKGAHTLHDGPYAETREQLAGFYIVDVADADAAMKWAKEIPLQEGGAIEVRPIWPMG